MRGIQRAGEEVTTSSSISGYLDYGGSETTRTTRSPQSQLQPASAAVLAATEAGAGFWLASVAGPGGVLPGQPPAPPPRGPTHHLMDCATAAVVAAAGETGFISSQPSMAEFMTALPQIGPDGPLQHSPGAGGGGGAGGPMSPGYHGMMDPHGQGQDGSGVNVPEYAWMKEKKTTRKSSQQGES